MVSEGKHSYAEIGEKYGVSKARISQILQRYYEELPDDGSRDIQRAKLEKLQEEMFAIALGPGKPMVSPGGKQVFQTDEDGNILYGKPLYDQELKIKGALAAVTISERLAKSNAWDKRKPTEKDESSEYANAMEYVESLAKQNRELESQKEILAAKLADHEDNQDVVEAEIIEDEENPPPAAYAED